MSLPISFGKVLSSRAGRRMGIKKKAPKIKRACQTLQMLTLEDRVVPALMQPTFIVYHPAGVEGPFTGSKSPSTSGNVITPAKMQQAYGENIATYGSIVGNGAGQTIAIVDAYNDPTATADLTAFDAAFTPAIPAPPSFKVISQTGSTTSLPSNNTGWSVEESLDIEYSHVMAPAANIILVEANASDDSDLLAAVEEAKTYDSKVSVVSMSRAEEHRPPTRRTTTISSKPASPIWRPAETAAPTGAQ